MNDWAHWRINSTISLITQIQFEFRPNPEWKCSHWLWKRAVLIFDQTNFPKNRGTEGNLKPSYGLNLIDLHWQNTLVWEPRLRIVPEDPIKNRGRRKVTLPGGTWEPSSGARPRIKARWAAVGRVNHKAWLDTARRSYVTTSPSCGPTTYGQNRWGRMCSQRGGSEGRGCRRTGPGQQRLALGT